MGLDWQTAAAIIIAGAAIISLIIQYFKKDDVWKDVTDQLTLRITTLEVQVKHLTESVELLRKKIESDETRETRELEKVENKVEKLTDLLIQLIQQDNAPPSKKK